MTIRKIACCVDFSEHARAAFDTSLELAEKFAAKLYVIHVLPPVVNPLVPESDWIMPEEPKKALIIKIEEKIQEEYGSKVGENIDFEFLVLDGHVSSEIIRFVGERDIDLVLLGSYGASGMGLVLFGSVANRIAHKAPCSVMIVRPKGQVPQGVSHGERMAEMLMEMNDPAANSGVSVSLLGRHSVLDTESSTVF